MALRRKAPDTQKKHKIVYVIHRYRTINEKLPAEPLALGTLAHKSLDSNVKQVVY